MFTVKERDCLVAAMELALASMKRGSNSAKQQEFKAVYDQQLIVYGRLVDKVRSMEVSSDGEVQAKGRKE
jgi:hypothetical protein